ncbi:MAG: ABC transporter permease [Actinobacteria bacterium HGW-Actinobacteria-7]|jgi:ABC-2 type transport system permease protein|nr:MAG: ABC transporter permease [Actinobacteria bacterium HGW-Actinobacteria-7]
MSLRRIRLLIWKEFLQLSRDRMILPILIIMPLLQLVLFGYVVGADIKDLRLAVLDRDGTTVSRSVTEAFTAAEYFKLTVRAHNDADVQRALDGNRASVAIEIPKGFADQVERGESAQLQLIVDGSDGRVSQMAGAYAAGIVNRLNTELYPRQAALAKGNVGIDARTRVLFNPAVRAINTMVPGLLAFILLISTSAIMSQAVVKERERGTLEQLFVTPVGRTEYLTGKLVPYALVSVVQASVVFTVGTLWFKVPFRGSGFVLALGLALFLFTSLGMGLLISLVSRTRQQAQQMIIFLQMPQMILSGFMFPLEVLPKWLYAVTFVVPLRYILVVVRSVFLKGSGLAELWPQFAALTVFAVGIFALGLSRFHKQLSD